MKKVLIVFSILFLISSCASFKEPEFEGINGFNIKKIDGKIISFSLQATVFNPNWFALKIKKSSVDVYLQEQYMGKLYLENNLKIIPKTENNLSVPLRMELEDGALFSLIKYAKKETVNIRFKGKVRGGVFFVSKKFPVDETQTISGKDLRIGLPK
jgi:LEA14-like dessication related protein